MLLSTKSSAAKKFKVFNSISAVSEIVDHHLPAYGDGLAIRYDNGFTYESMNYDVYLNQIKVMIRFFEREHEKQHVVATFCKNRQEWDMTALATFYTGNTIFPLDTKMNAVELRHLLSMNPPDYMLLSVAQLQRMRDLIAELQLPTKFLVADLLPVFEDQDVEPCERGENEISIAELARNTDITGSFSPSPRLDDPNIVLGHYGTSGTTSLPKIVQITHQNIVCEVNEAIDVINLRVNEELLNIGPYTHIATLVEFLVTKTRGFAVTYFTREPDEDKVLENEIAKLKRQGVRIKVLLAVPKFWIYVLKEVLEEMKNKPVLHNLYLHLTSIEKHANLHDIGTLDKAKLAAMRVFLRNKLGGYFSYGISSSSKLDGALVQIFGKLGVTVIDIYGATELSGIISRNRLNDINAGTCGRIIAPLEYRLVNKEIIPGVPYTVGEFCVKGPTLMKGYLHEPPNQHLDEKGYFNTGDLASVDDKGLLRLVGRRKELIRWDDGTYVDPMHLSNMMVRSVFVKDALVTRLRPDDSDLSVFVFPDYPRIRKDPKWQKQISTGVPEKEALRGLLEEAIDYAESIAQVTPRFSKERIYLLPKPLERTPTHKIKFLFELERLDLNSYV
jgi:long-chain acyl-CoA synthetase